MLAILFCHNHCKCTYEEALAITLQHEHYFGVNKITCDSFRVFSFICIYESTALNHVRTLTNSKAFFRKSLKGDITH